MLQHRRIEWRELHDHARRQIAEIEREVAAAEAWRGAERGGDIPHGAEVPHLLDGDLDDGAPPARRSAASASAEPSRASFRLKAAYR